MKPYEQYLLNDYKKPTMTDNPFSLYGEKTAIAPDWDTSAQIKGELSNRPVYNSRGERYGNTLTDDMIDIKNGRRGNPETSNHPWVGDIYDYTNIPNYVTDDPLPVLEKIDYTPAVLRDNDFRNNGISRKKNITEGNYDWYGESPAIYGQNALRNYEPSDFQDPDYSNYLETDNDYNRLMQRINELKTDNTSPYADSIRDDVKYIKSEGRTGHLMGDMAPRIEAEYDPALPTYPEDTWGLLVNPERLSPATAELIAKNTTQDRPEYTDNWGEKTGLNPLINLYRRKLEMENPPSYAGGQYMQGIY